MSRYNTADTVVTDRRTR